MATDHWAAWIRKRRFGGDADRAERDLAKLGQTRDKVLDRAELQGGETVLDVGCGDGLIGLGALERGAGEVIFSDVSEPLLEDSRALAAAAGMLGRCRFVRAGAEDLAPIADGSVDVVTTRSVLIYVMDKAAAFAEFFRVLRPGGRISLFEPINASAPATGRQRPQAQIEPTEPQPWETFANSAGNPKIPTLAEAMEQSAHRKSEPVSRPTCNRSSKRAAARGGWRRPTSPPERRPASDT